MRDYDFKKLYNIRRNCERKRVKRRSPKKKWYLSSMSIKSRLMMKQTNLTMVSTIFTKTKH